MGYYTTGFAQASAHQNTRKAWDTLLHEQVNNLLVFKGLIGTDKGGEGALDAHILNKPIVQKTQLSKDSGDQITMGLMKKLSGVGGGGTTAWFNDGVVGNVQLVDSEDGITMHNVKVKIAHIRQGVKINGRSTLQRSPYSLMSEAKNALANSLASQYDRSILFALYSGFSPNVLRELGVTEADPTAHPNRIFGKGKATLPDVDSTDKLDTDALELCRVFWQQENISAINVDGEGHLILLIHPRGGRTLRADSLWQDGNINGMPRSKDNPVFQNAIGSWAGIVVRESNIVETSFDYNVITVAANKLEDLTAATMGAGVSATDVHMNVLIGANAVARAYGLENYMERRKEDKPLSDNNLEERGTMYIEDFLTEEVYA